MFDTPNGHPDERGRTRLADDAHTVTVDPTHHVFFRVTPFDHRLNIDSLS